MALKIIGIGEMHCSSTPQDDIVTLGLGSCVALVVAHAPSGYGAMAHIALPSSKVAHIKSKDYPSAYFADLAVQGLLDQLEQRTNANPAHLEISLIGGASMAGKSAMAIGDKNVSAVLQQLSKLKIALRHRLVGGHLSRNVRLQVGSGAIWVKEGNAPERVLGPAQGYPFKKQSTGTN